MSSYLLTKDPRANGHAPVPNRQSSVSKAEKYGWSVVDSEGEFAWVEKERLDIDQTYQRENVSNAKVLNIAREWSWLACGVLLVAKRDGKLLVYDGQHRLLAAMRRTDICKLPCMVFSTSDAKDDATGFLRVNTNRKPLTTFDRWQALLRTEDPNATFIANLLASSGYTPSPEFAKTESRSVKCLGVLLHLARDKRPALESCWPVLVEVHEGMSFHERVVASVVLIEHMLMKSGQSLTRQPMRGRLVRLGRQGVLEAAARAATFYAKGGAAVWARGVCEAMNRGCRNRIDPFLSDSTEE